MLVLTFIFLFYNHVVPCYGHFAQKCLWHFQGNLCARATRWASPVQRWDGGVVRIRGKPLWRSTRKIWKRFHWHSARFCKYAKMRAHAVTSSARWQSWFMACLNCTGFLHVEDKCFELEHVPCCKLGKGRPHAVDSLLYSQNFKSQMIAFPLETLI